MHLLLCHAAIKQKAQLTFDSTFPTYTGFSSNCFLYRSHTLRFTCILVSNLLPVSSAPKVSWSLQMQSDWKLFILSQGKHTDFLFLNLPGTWL